ncbi:unnamed protein product [Adineta steineri]|uniref:HMG box domain-containing protein n=1 Tax=Adineta steineri TaxID=433720 RepID=A0A814BS12_9BILA|nr:unnamed protein product [Adineta steineri]CAF3644068.1 unnamed protein product [Adineta steineri]
MARRSNQKRNHDRNAPKRPSAAWRLFFDDHREEFTKQNPKSSYHKISKKLGEMWRQSDDVTKRRYQKQYETNQAEYDEKMEVYTKDRDNKKSQSSVEYNN